MRDFIKDMIIATLLIWRLYEMPGWSVSGFMKILVAVFLVVNIALAIYGTEDAIRSYIKER